MNLGHDRMHLLARYEVSRMLSIRLRNFVRKGGALVFGRLPHVHRIPFGPNKGFKIFTCFDISPRMYFGIAEPWIAALVEQYAKSGDIVYDIGAHIGYTSLLFRRSVGETGRVHAFEILPSVAKTFFQRTMEENGFSNVIVHSVGLSNEEQTIQLSMNDTRMAQLSGDNSSQSRSEQCRTVRLDEFISRQGLPIPSLMKIDIEGAEVDCLMGALDTIKARRPVLIVEFHSLDLLRRGHSLLRSVGYELRTRHVEVDEEYLGRLTRFHESVLCAPRAT